MPPGRGVCPEDEGTLSTMGSPHPLLHMGEVSLIAATMLGRAVVRRGRHICYVNRCRKKRRHFYAKNGKIPESLSSSLLKSLLVRRRPGAEGHQNAGHRRPDDRPAGVHEVDGNSPGPEPEHQCWRAADQRHGRHDLRAGGSGSGRLRVGLRGLSALPPGGRVFPALHVRGGSGKRSVCPVLLPGEGHGDPGDSGSVLHGLVCEYYPQFLRFHVVLRGGSGQILHLYDPARGDQEPGAVPH